LSISMMNSMTGWALLLASLVSCGAPPFTDRPESPTPEESGETSSAAEPDQQQAILAEERLARKRRREELNEKAKSWPGWELFESEHYFVLTEVDDTVFVDEALRRLEAVRKELVREFPPEPRFPERNPFSPVVVLLFENAAAYHEYGGPAGSSSYYRASAQEMVFYDTRDDGDSGEGWSTMQHIAVHAYFDTALDLETAPPWLLYGTAAIYAGMVHRDGELRLDHFDGKFAELRRFANRSPRVPLEALLSFDRPAFYGENEFDSPARANLVLAWSLAFYLRTQASDDPLWEDSWSELVSRFILGWQESGTLSGARERGLEGVDLEALDAAWKAWIDRSVW
jgi:hypothetical protein